MLDAFFILFLVAETVPSELESLTKLDTLSLEGNRISSIPQSIFPKLKSLKSVSLAGNRLTVFPIEICQLQNLDAVDLSSNRIDSIPDSLESLKAIELNLNSNRLNVLPSSLAKCERLKVLRVQENCLSLDSITTEILKDSQISLLACEGNLFEMKAMHDKDGYDEVCCGTLDLDFSNGICLCSRLKTRFWG